MAQFNVHRMSDGTLMLDCQADFLAGYNSRIVAPLILFDPALPAMRRLNPVFSLDGSDRVMMTEFLSAVPLGELGKPVATLQHEEYVIKAALDMLITGY